MFRFTEHDAMKLLCKGIELDNNFIFALFMERLMCGNDLFCGKLMLFLIWPHSAIFFYFNHYFILFSLQVVSHSTSLL